MIQLGSIFVLVGFAILVLLTRFKIEE